METYWLVDPIDGTTNYTRQLEFFSVSIALIDKGVPVVGVVNCPKLGQLYSARSGNGAHCNGDRITVSDKATIAESILTTSMPYETNARKKVLQFLDKASQEVDGIRLFLSCAYDLCLLSRGSIDSSIFFGVSPWDIAAGLCILKEAGGQFTDDHGNVWAPASQLCVASNGQVHNELLKLLSR